MCLSVDYVKRDSSISRENNNKILILGAASIQVPAIVQARENGYYVITCSYDKNDPGHAFSDEYYNVSIIDADEVLTLARNLEVRMVLAYASDAATPTAAYVNQRLGLAGNPFKTIQILTEKDRFKQFLKFNDFNTPVTYSVSQEDQEIDILPEMNYPVVVKPIDSSGCRGSSLVRTKSGLKQALNYALTFSRKHRAVVEEYIHKEGPELTGDGFVLDGELVFLHLGDHHYDHEINELLAYATTWPSVLPSNKLKLVKEEVSRALQKVGYRNGPINIDARIGIDGKVYILEIAPRNGGNFIPQLLKLATGFDSVAASLKLVSGESVDPQILDSKYVAIYLLHSSKKGRFSDLKYSKQIEDFVIDKKLFVEKGNEINVFKDLSRTVGLMFMEFDDHEEMIKVILNLKKYFEINLLHEPLKENTY